MATGEDDEPEDTTTYSENASVVDPSAGDAIRRTLADVYTFVRSAETNKTIAGFTLDHYIEEAKNRIKTPRILRSASDPEKGVGTRPAQLEALERLEEEFNKTYAKAKELAEKAGESGTP